MKTTFAAPFVLAIAAGCASSTTVGTPPVLKLGDHYDTSMGKLFVLRIQDEYKVIRCTTEGPIKGCYEDVLLLPIDTVKFNSWFDVTSVPGVQVALISPEEVAFRTLPSAGSPR